MKKIAISTWCTDDYAVHLMPDKLKKLVNHFHPEIDFHIVDTKQTEEIKKENPWSLHSTTADTNHVYEDMPMLYPPENPKLDKENQRSIKIALIIRLLIPIGLIIAIL